MKNHHSSTSRYCPATKQDHGREIRKIDYCECENEGMDTHTHTSKYVPGGEPGLIFKWMGSKDKKEGTNMKSDWLGLHIRNNP